MLNTYICIAYEEGSWLCGDTTNQRHKEAATKCQKTLGKPGVFGFI
jgi:hypothetical protein